MCLGMSLKSTRGFDLTDTRGKAVPQCSDSSKSGLAPKVATMRTLGRFKTIVCNLIFMNMQKRTFKSLM